MEMVQYEREKTLSYPSVRLPSTAINFQNICALTFPTAPLTSFFIYNLMVQVDSTQLSLSPHSSFVSLLLLGAHHRDRFCYFVMFMSTPFNSKFYFIL